MSNTEDFFIGWAETPKPDRRFLLAASLGLIAAGAGVASMLARAHAPAGAGAWAMGVAGEWSGYLTRAPFPALITRELDGAWRTAFIVGAGKDGVQLRLGARPAGPARVRGSLITRGRHAMIAAADSSNWIEDAEALEEIPVATEEDLGEALLVGEILDAKCWFGAMRPADGKIHKSCAALCIRGGLPPAFCIGSVCGEGADAPLLLDANGAAHGRALLPLVADPVRAMGRLVRVGDVVQFRAAIEAIRRL